VGTAVVAARAGIIVAVQESSQTGGMDSAYEKDGNHIIILHDDNTFSIYAHLKYKGSVVKVGDIVRAGSVVGYSGNTGMSSGPHLHFEVYKVAHLNEGSRNSSILTRFLNDDGKAVVPEEGVWYYSTHPGKGSYEVVLGRNYKDEHFLNFKETVPTDNDFKIETKTVDNTVLIFARNGFDKIKELTFEFSEIINMKPSKPLPHVQRIPANSKVYIMLMRPDRGKGKWQYRYKYKVR
ncbi:MAG: peptidoglycan DD-metalloendopeptidase family protein, partial [Proteobacteria bacterium]|nr:peptidoglycan DD-metalloendopeptidase family protein [Pseudomonadota bacterium]